MADKDSRRIKKIEIYPAHNQEGKGIYLPPEKIGRNIYEYDRNKDDPLKSDDEIWSEGMASAEAFFVEFFTSGWVYGAARNKLKKEIQTRLSKEEWSVRVESLKEQAVKDWIKSLKGPIVNTAVKPDFEEIAEGKYEFNFVVYADQYDDDLRMVFTVEMEIRPKIEIKIPTGKYSYWQILSMIIRQLKDKFPFTTSREVIKELVETGQLIRFVDPETGYIRYRPS